MSNHKIALVPISTGYFQSPELLSLGRKTDIGLFAESLIYYDSVYVHVDNPEQFVDFISQLIRHGLSYKKLIELVKEGILRFLCTGWIMPFAGTGHPNIFTALYFIKEEAMNKPNYFGKRFLEFRGLRNKFLNTLDFREFCKATQETAITLASDDFALGLVDNEIGRASCRERV